MSLRFTALADSQPLILAADARFGVPDYVNDQVWELAESRGDPPALVVRTMYGLRAKEMSLFPGFVRSRVTLSNPQAFHIPPQVEAVFPNYARLRLAPWPEIEVSAEYWVPESHALAGRYQLTNTTGESQTVGFRLHAVLQPDEGSGVMHLMTYRGVSVLGGESGGLRPVVFLSGGATVEPAAHPALGLSIELAPGETRHLTWAHVGLRDPEASFGLARAMAERVWDAEIARLELVNARLLDVETGNPAWDRALGMAQITALRSLLGPTRHLPYPSPVASRRPDQGYSPSRDGRDYPQPWAGQSAAMALSVVPLLVYAAPELAQGVICDFLHNPHPDGGLDSRPGLGGQRTGALCPPVLAGLALKVFQSTEDLGFLRSVRPGLMMAAKAWFNPMHDCDEDGFPEWDNTPQAMNEDSPTFVRWHSWGQGLDIGLAETPDLGSYLIKECQALLEMGRLLGVHDDDAWLEATAGLLHDRLERAWSEELNAYLAVDRDKHVSPSGQEIVRKRGSFSHKFKGHYEQPVRVIIRCFGPESEASKLKLRIHGRSRRGRSRVERLSNRHLQWFWEFGTATTAKTYVEITQVEVLGSSDAFETEFIVADFTRLEATSMLPLWAGVPDQDRARDLVGANLLSPERFWRRHGLSRCPADDPAYDPDSHLEACGVSPVQNAMLAEGLLNYGYRAEAAEAFERLMTAISLSLARDNCFRAVYHPDQPGGAGERDEILGAAPLGLFLDLIGVRLISPSKVRLEHSSPFDHPVRLRWCGLEITRQGDRTSITFPNGQQVTAQGEAPSVVEQMHP